MSEDPEYVEMTFGEAYKLQTNLPYDADQLIRTFAADIIEHTIDKMESATKTYWGESEWERLTEALEEVQMDLENMLPMLKVWVKRKEDDDGHRQGTQDDHRGTGQDTGPAAGEGTGSQADPEAGPA